MQFCSVLKHSHKIISLVGKKTPKKQAKIVSAKRSSEIYESLSEGHRGGGLWIDVAEAQCFVLLCEVVPMEVPGGPKC